MGRRWSFPWPKVLGTCLFINCSKCQQFHQVRGWHLSLTNSLMRLNKTGACILFYLVPSLDRVFSFEFFPVTDNIFGTLSSLLNITSLCIFPNLEIYHLLSYSWAHWSLRGSQEIHRAQEIYLSPCSWIFDGGDLNLVLSVPNPEPQSPHPDKSFGSYSEYCKVELRLDKHGHMQSLVNMELPHLWKIHCSHFIIMKKRGHDDGFGFPIFLKTAVGCHSGWLTHTEL